jgi:hypothetical protein
MPRIASAAKPASATSELGLREEAVEEPAKKGSEAGDSRR